MLEVSQLDPSPDNIDAKIEELDQQGMNDCLWLTNHQRTLMLRYEDFHRDFENLFSSLEGFLEVSLTSQARQEFEKRFDIEAVKGRANSLQSFRHFHPDDLIHGRHISKHSGKPGAHINLLDAHAKRKIQDRFASFFHTFNY